MRETQMKEAKQQMKEKAKELAKARSATGKRGGIGGAMAVSIFKRIKINRAIFPK